MYYCQILADSIAPHGERLTTFEITYPYIIHAEIMTHRMFSRNTQSSRATPMWKNIEKVQNDPFVPKTFRQNAKGMADGQAIEGDRLERSELVWRSAIQDAVRHARALEQLDVHKALGNRVMSPYQWFTMILTATDFDNFFALRCHPEAQTEIRTIAEQMEAMYKKHEPRRLREGEWHLPLVRGDERALERKGSDFWIPISIGRCARVSYLTHSGRRDIDSDIALYLLLLQNGHMSPFEHVARPFNTGEWSTINNVIIRNHASDTFIDQLRRGMEYAGNLHGWWSARMDVPNQHNYALHSTKQAV